VLRAISTCVVHGFNVWSVLSLACAVGGANGATGLTVGDALKKPDAWFPSAEGRQALSNVLSHQSLRGDWPKNTRTAAAPSTNTPARIQGTFDNGATTGELRLLARAFRATQNQAYRDAFVRGLDHILGAQYTNGGWPQYAPPPANSYHRHITFNDGTMQRLLELLRDVAKEPAFDFVDDPRRASAASAIERGIRCILQCQVVVGGRKTVWCAQHDEVTLQPRRARSYELESLSGSESAGLLLFLMSQEKPSPEMMEAIEAGARWFESSKLTGLREVRIDGDKRMIADPGAPPLWARFYEIESNRPFYCGRDGIKKFNLSEIESERRSGYAWHGAWGENVRQRFVAWQQQHK
jgi:PelA/Pel-15E family pectate lyase